MRKTLKGLVCAATCAIVICSAIFMAGCAGLVSGTSNSTSPAPTGLMVSNVQTSSVTTSGSQVTWTTDAPADSSVDYGTTTSFGSTTSVNSTMVTSHQITLSGLAAGTTYYYQVNSTDAKGNKGHGKSSFSTAGFSVSGAINPTVAGSGTTVTLSGAKNATTTPDGSGAYTFTGLPSGSYGVKPTNPNYSFSPANQAVSVSAANVAGVNFSASTAVVAPSITTQPASQTVTPGQAATFAVAATGTAPLTYQWQKNGANVTGATSSSYTTPVTATSDSGSAFDVVVSNAAGTVTSGIATLTVNAATVAPSITTQPASQTVTAGQTATFAVAATGTAPLSYQWRKNGTAISGATSFSYTTPATTSTDNGAQFTVVVSNSAGTVTSGIATLSVNVAAVAPSITTQPISQTVTAGQTATFAVAATGTAPLSYQWQKNGTAISGATSSGYTTPATTSTDNGAQFTVVVSNSAGSATSSAATLTVNAATVAPSITTQPTSQTVTAGQTASFTVAATGTPPLSYQWQKNGTAISGATSSGYTTPATTSTDNGAQFTVVVSNSAGTVTSGVATLTVNATVVAPSITAQPASLTVTAGQTATFTVTATGTAPLSYQWQKNGTNIVGATSTSYTTPATTTSDGGSTFDVVISNSAGTKTSTVATLTVNAAAVAPSITTQPASQTVTAGQTATFTVASTGTAPLSYQWQKNGANITGATSNSYTTPVTATSDSGSTFDVVVSNSAGTVTSGIATLTVNAAAVAPSITTQPASLTVTAGQTATFTVTATGTAALSYQWKKNGTAISGATSSSYTTPATTNSDSGAQFTVVVTNSAGSATSNAATLTVNAAAVAPSITTQPTSQTVTAGQTATFTVAATGTAPLSYQWQKSGANIAGATSSSYTTPVTATSDSGSTFDVVVSNSAGTVTSGIATLTVNAAAVAPTITTQPTSQTVSAGQTATFAVTATGTAPLSYQWKKNGTAISGATSSNYTTPATTSTDNGAQFMVVVSNSAGSATSNAATLTVNATPPTVPTGLTATAASSSQINLAWSASTDSTGTLAGYKIYRGGTQIATSTTTSYQDTGLAASTSYTYNVAAYDTAGNTSAQSGSASATTQASSGGGGGALPTSLGWYQIPNTNIGTLCPPYSEIQGTTGCQAVMSAWNGGLFDTQRDRLIIFGGGHHDYYGNEVYAINLSANPITKTLVKDSAHNPNMNGVPPNCPDVYGDGTPVSRHTYGSLVYIPSTDRYLAYSGARSDCGFFTTASWDFNPSTNTWAQTGSGPGASGSQPIAAYDSVTNTVYAVDNNVVALWTYSPSSRTWTNQAGISTVCQTTTPSATIDPVRRLMFCVGGGVLSKISLTAPYAASNLTGSGCSAWMGQAAPGIAYDPVQKLMVGWAGGNTVYLYNPDTDSCSTVTSYTGGPTTIQANGTYGRFQYSPSSGVFVVVNDINSNGYALRLTPASGGGSSVSVSVSPTSASVQTSATQQFSATVTGSTNTAVTWTATAGTVSTSGLFTAPTSTGTVTVTATSVADTTKSASATVTVTSAAPPPVAVSISPTSASVLISATQQFTATVTGSTNTAVTWTATGGTVSTSGLFTAPASAGTFTVTATSVADSTKSASAAVTVTTTGGAVNGWTSRTAGVNIPGGLASIVSNQNFDTTLTQTCTAPCNSWAPGKQIYAQYYNAGSPATDCTISADGPCSLKFTVTNGSFQGDAGWYDYNFSPAFATGVGQFGAGQEVYIQYKIRLDPGILGVFSGAGGLKHDITTEGDSATVQAGDCSNSPGEVVTIEDNTAGFNGPWMYVNCGYSGGTLFFTNNGYEPLQLGGAPSSNFLDQNAAGCPHYANQGITISDPNCFIYVGNEWFTIQKHIKVGSFGTASSVIEQWVAHANAPSVLINNAADAALPNDGSGGASGKYGKIQLSTYDTGATFNVNTAAWFDDLIVSTRRIPDPDVATPNAPDSLSLSNITASSVTVNWRVNSQNGTAQDDTGFLVERCTGTGASCFPNPQSGFQQIGTTAAGASSYVDTTVVAGTTYTYRVRAKNASGNSPYAVAQCFNGGSSCGGSVVP